MRPEDTGGPIDEATLTELLVEERPQIDENFAAELDRWAAEGFPHRSAPRRSKARGERVVGFLREALAKVRTVPPRRILMPAGALASVVVVATVAVSQVGELGGGDGADAPTLAVEGGGDSDEGTVGGGGAAEEAPAAPSLSDEAIGELDSTRQPAAGGADSSAGESGGVRNSLEKDDDGALFGTTALDADSDPIKGRRVIQNVELEVATTPEEFRGAADEVYAIVGNHEGFVKSSAVTGGDPEAEAAAPGRATFELRIPESELQETLTELSALGNVLSRTDGTQDVTGNVTNTIDDIDRLRIERDELKAQIDELEPSPERRELRFQLGRVKTELDAELKRLDDLHDRIRLVPVSLSLEAREDAGDDGDWDLGEAVDDAGQILTVIAGVALISAAILLPLAIIVAVAWLLISSGRRRGRERALDE